MSIYDEKIGGVFFPPKQSFCVEKYSRHSNMARYNPIRNSSDLRDVF
jgi:hypothetical protein